MGEGGGAMKNSSSWKIRCWSAKNMQWETDYFFTRSRQLIKFLHSTISIRLYVLPISFLSDILTSKFMHKVLEWFFFSNFKHKPRTHNLQNIAYFYKIPNVSRILRIHFISHITKSNLTRYVNSQNTIQFILVSSHPKRISCRRNNTNEKISR